MSRHKMTQIPPTTNIVPTKIGRATNNNNNNDPIHTSTMASLLHFKTLPLSVADEMATLAIQTAKQHSFKPIAVCVMDASGYPIVTKRADGVAPMAYPPLAQQKAATCVSFKASSRSVGDKYLSDGKPSTFCRVLNQVTTLEGRAVAFPGGVLIRDATDNQIVGSIGISGAAGAEDEYCGIQAVKLCSIGEELVTEPAEGSI